MESFFSDPFYIFGIHYQYIILISAIVALASFIGMAFSVKIGGIIFQISIGILWFMLVYWIAAFFYSLFGFTTGYLKSPIFYLFLLILLLISVYAYIYFNLYKTFFDTD
ncbi:MAG: hypothetical protein JW995_16230 [Melioribacteraceae bacterium]|nr:hypothetical protein [Melioribacteraceae bacterium]